MTRLRFNKIFWKIFATFWLVNLSVIFSASYVIVNTLENARFLNIHEQLARKFAAEQITRFERGEAPRNDGRPPRGGGPGAGRDSPPIPRLKIIGEDGTVVSQRNFRFRTDTRGLTFEITSDSGKRYNVETQLPRRPLFFKEILQRLQSTQFFLILIASTLASALLSWTISRPLKKLGASSREVAQGDLNARPDQTLLTRGDEIGDLARDFDDMVRQLGASLNGQRQLLHDVSHELRAPLARLQAAAALAEKKPGDSQYTAKIHHECERMNLLIQQILDYSRYHEIPEDRENINLGELLEQVCTDIRFSYPNHNLRLLGKDKSVWFTGFAESLSRAFTNFLENACKYAPEGSFVTMTISEGNAGLQITVCDQGPGIPAALLPRVTEPFFQTAAENSQKGFGLGLSIARRAVEKNNGKLAFSNGENGGLCVTVYLPGGVKPSL